ncbi:methionine ABC transporter ATP-binding protein [Defluviitalea phaphyphila]|uniref:methionine ABC transporter ATP-binding protein n=1 Tax=Defluviitalea phaphyphila TaxID=1473580 RepID=UPI000731BCEE|nr:methionine ABC transporter ATP-binding protein [Defluviitalea phaphyphila]
MIEVKGLYKEFRDKGNIVKALKNINITIEKGDIFGIIGLSGAGKSTLVRCINRLEEPTKGKVLIKGQDVMDLNASQLRELRKKIGMIFQHFNLLNSRSVAENISYPLEISKVPKEEREKRIDELLKLVELEDKKNSYPSQLSGGQKQRVGIARALANHPDVLLCDEATSALDPKTTQSILKLLKKINEKLGLTIVIITHEMEVIKQICNKVAVMENGEIVESGMVSKVFAHPKNEITKNFVKNIGHDIPEELFKELGFKKLVRLNFEGSGASNPILSKMIKKYDIDANILFGGIDHLQNNLVGNLIVELKGKEEEIEKAICFLKENEVECEVISL